MADMLTVSALNRYVKRILDANDTLYDLALQGEIANFVQNARSGHCYFSLRDAQASVKAVMFRSDAQRLSFQPEEGMKVVVRCRVTLYERDGAFQIYVSDIVPDGIGAAQLAFEQLKEKLAQEGLFDEGRKKPIPTCPRAIGLVTSKTGAALQDIYNVTARRWPMVRLVLCPVNVQGFEAAGQIAAAITTLDKSKKVDCIIVARGGGSREDLWVFNAEPIARAAASCATPLISAIGHEIDYSILDFVSDLRAPTPSAAAELAVPDISEVVQKIYNLQVNIQIIMQNRMQMCYNRCAEQLQRFKQQGIHNKMQSAVQSVAHVTAELPAQMQRYTQQHQTLLSHAAALTDSLSPYRTLARGYAFLEDEKGEIVKVESLKKGQTVQLIGATKAATCLVQTVEELSNENTEKL